MYSKKREWLWYFDRVGKVSRPCYAEWRAWVLFQYAEGKTGRRLEDREAYDWLQKNRVNAEELADYDLPAFDTWTRYLRIVRGILGKQKYVRHSAPPAEAKVVREERDGRSLEPRVKGPATVVSPEPPAVAPALLDVKAVAKMLGCSWGHVYHLVYRGAMPRPVKLGALVRWRRVTGDPTTGLEDWIKAGCPSCREGGRR